MRILFFVGHGARIGPGLKKSVGAKIPEFWWVIFPTWWGGEE